MSSIIPKILHFVEMPKRDERRDPLPYKLILLLP